MSFLLKYMRSLSSLFLASVISICFANRGILLRDIRAGFVLLVFIFAVSIPAFSNSVSWDGGGDGTSWSDSLNWNPNNVPAAGDDITIDCSCSIIVSANLIIDGSLIIAAGTTINMGGWQLEIDKTNNNAVFSNHGTITNCLMVKAKGTGSVPEGPFATNTGTLTTLKFDVVIDTEITDWSS